MIVIALLGVALFVFHILMMIGVTGVADEEYEDGEYDPFFNTRSMLVCFLLLLPFFLPSLGEAIHRFEWFGSPESLDNPFWYMSVLGFSGLPFWVVAFTKSRLVLHTFAVIILLFLLVDWFYLIVFERYFWVLLAPCAMFMVAFYLVASGRYDDPDEITDLVPTEIELPQPPPLDPFDDFERPPSRSV